MDNNITSTVPANFLVRAWEKEKAIVLGNFEAIRTNPGKKFVHDFRVGTKKIRSYLRLMEILSGETWKEEYKKLSDLFRVFGKYRDAQMSFSLFGSIQRKENIQVNAILFHFRNNISITRKWVMEAVNTSPLEEILNSLSTKFHTAISPLDDDYISDKIRSHTISYFHKTDLRQEVFKKEAHLHRKELKDIYYWLIICPVNPVFDKNEMAKLEKSLDQLGKWQDQYVFRLGLRSFRKQWMVKNSMDFRTTKHLEQSLATWSDELVEKSRHQLKSLQRRITEEK